MLGFISEKIVKKNAFIKLQFYPVFRLLYFMDFAKVFKIKALLLHVYVI